jgi:hypothetical protein
MARTALSIKVKLKDRKELAQMLSGGVQQVRVLLRAVALLQLGKVSVRRASPALFL